jgi:hypothetical protein
MNICTKCGKRYDYTDQGNLIRLGVFSNITRCPNCGQNHRSDYLSIMIITVAFGVLFYSFYLIYQSGFGDLYLRTRELLIASTGLVGIFFGFRSIKLVRVNETY